MVNLRLVIHHPGLKRAFLILAYSSCASLWSVRHEEAFWEAELLLCSRKTIPEKPFLHLFARGAPSLTARKAYGRSTAACTLNAGVDEASAVHQGQRRSDLRTPAVGIFAANQRHEYLLRHILVLL